MNNKEKLNLIENVFSDLKERIYDLGLPSYSDIIINSINNLEIDYKDKLINK